MQSGRPRIGRTDEVAILGGMMHEGCTPRIAAMPADWLGVIDIEVGILPTLLGNQHGGWPCIVAVIA